jgi:hypothetical protein
MNDDEIDFSNLRAGASNPEDLEPDYGKLAEKILSEPKSLQEEYDPQGLTTSAENEQWDLRRHTLNPRTGKRDQP